MTTRTELSEIIANGENSGVEFKQVGLRPDSLAKALVGFLNFKGGIVLIGVADDGNVTGIVRDEHPDFDLEQWVTNVCRDRIDPPVDAHYEVYRDVRDDNSVALVKVDHGYGLHAVLRNGNRKYYLRVGSHTIEASQHDLARIMQQRGAIRSELQNVPNTTIEDLDHRRLNYYFGEIRKQELPADLTVRRQILINTEIMTPDGVTTAGLLLFGTNPKKHLVNSGVDATAYPGKEKDYASIEKVSIRGPMTPLIDGEGDIVENGLVEQVLEFVRRNTPVEVVSEGGMRIEKRTYPEDAIRESIVNALVHRNYLFTGTDIELSVYCDRLEIVSPGRLPNGLTIEQIKLGARFTTNQLLKDVMRDFRYVEHVGMGVPRKIIKGMRDHNGTDPLFVDEGRVFKLTLFANKDQYVDE